jgi:hypothetical protein
MLRLIFYRKELTKMPNTFVVTDLRTVRIAPPHPRRLGFTTTQLHPEESIRGTVNASCDNLSPQKAAELLAQRQQAGIPSIIFPASIAELDGLLPDPQIITIPKGTYILSGEREIVTLFETVHLLKLTAGLLKGLADYPLPDELKTEIEEIMTQKENTQRGKDELVTVCSRDFLDQFTDWFMRSSLDKLDEIITPAVAAREIIDICIKHKDLCGNLSNFLLAEYRKKTVLPFWERNILINCENGRFFPIGSNNLEGVMLSLKTPDAANRSAE